MIVTSCNVLGMRSVTGALWLVAVMLAAFLGTLALVSRMFGL
jgi:hypothetical protein